MTHGRHRKLAAIRAEAHGDNILWIGNHQGGKFPARSRMEEFHGTECVPDGQHLTVGREYRIADQSRHIFRANHVGGLPGFGSVEAIVVSFADDQPVAVRTEGNAGVSRSQFLDQFAAGCIPYFHSGAFPGSCSYPRALGTEANAGWIQMIG